MTHRLRLQAIPSLRARVSDAVFRGPSVTLRPFTMEDVTATYVAWLNDPLVHQYLESRFVVQTVDGVQAYVAQVLADPHSRFFAIDRNDTGRHIGNCKIGPRNAHHGTASIGFLIGDRAAWGRGFATEAVGLGARVAFDVLDVRKLTAGAYAPNIGSIKALLRNEFVADGIRRAHYRDGPTFVDVLLFARFRDA